MALKKILKYNEAQVKHRSQLLLFRDSQKY